MESKTLEAILIEKNRHLSKLLLWPLIGLYAGLQLFIFVSEMASGRESIAQWLSRNESRLSQALFLRNHLDIKNIINEVQSANAGKERKLNVAVFNLKGKSLGSSWQRPQKINSFQTGYESNLLKGEVSYQWPIFIADHKQGYIHLSSEYNWTLLKWRSSVALACCLMLFLVLKLGSRNLLRTIRRAVIQPIQRLRRGMEPTAGRLDGWTTVDLKPFQSPEIPKELLELVTGYNHLIENNQVMRAREREFAANEATTKIAAQVAHDIRSPLTALNMVVGELVDLPENQRVLFRGAIARINDIANNLLDEKRKKRGATSIPGGIQHTRDEDSSIFLVSGVVAELISEKRYQFRSHLDLEIEMTGNFYGGFIHAPTNEFKRVLSNLINNSIEAIPKAGRVQVELVEHKTEIEIRIKDNGVGIASELLPLVTEAGATFGKKTGNGLGLYHAKSAIQAWKGKLEIQSVKDFGTQVILRVPKALPPAWFLSEINLSNVSTVLVVDDDASIHQVWQRRFDRLEGASVRVVHFSTTSELVEWHKQKGNEHSPLYLIDFEITGSAMNGIELIQELGIAAQSILVSSHHEEEKILKGCDSLQLKLIPKSLATYVPLRAKLKSLAVTRAFPQVEGVSGPSSSWQPIKISDYPHLEEPQ